MHRVALVSLRSSAKFAPIRRNVGNFEPPYLKLLKPPTPVHEGLLNIQLKGYDFVVLEQQTRRIEKLAALLNVSVTETWATPLQAFELHTFNPQSTVVDKTYKLNIYERNVQLEMLPGIIAGMLIDLIQKNLAAGVSVSIHKHLPEHTEVREIPDLELESLERQLEEIKNPPPHKKI
ncbi:39S ribosomal protein L48, mitochondrial-like [Varroa jacobsoni]|uniref:Small ribosomal subunit protein uS10 domain-containing protein n=1 Tax=Varroa destructor TaxID=109461 RepID=A0A7M7JDC7_VARDE|nr:39S ribosomal protein L48, mitochondrial-like [Varroa destructor]XP_022701195.1 39S ribosomal protein L48, mitochondrial-like [Varroa jacobsoni]